MINDQCSIINEGDLEKLAKQILVNKPQIIALEGPLGAGKTTLTKEIAKQLGITEIIISPTYVLETEYRIPDTRLHSADAESICGQAEYLFIHIDCYRMESFDELLRLGIQKRIVHNDLIIIEWADKFRSQIQNLKSQIIWVKIGLGEKKDERIIEII